MRDNKLILVCNVTLSMSEHVFKKNLQTLINQSLSDSTATWRWSLHTWIGWVFEVQMGILRRYMYNKPQKDVGQRKSSKNFNALASGQVIAGFESVPDKDHNCCEQNLILHEMPAVKSSIQIVFWWNDHVSNYHVTQSVKNSRVSQYSSHTSQSVIGIHCVNWSIILESDQQKTTHCAPILIMHHWCRIKTVLLYRKIIMIGGVFYDKIIISKEHWATCNCLQNGCLPLPLCSICNQHHMCVYPRFIAKIWFNGHMRLSATITTL